MLHLGKFNTLEIERESPHGLYLTDEIGNEVLLPNKFVTEEMEFGVDIEVFLYKDSEGRNVATTEQVKLQVGEIALLEVFDVNEIGAFMEWGVEKHLLIPFRNQGRRLSPGDETLVYMYLDEETHRLVGTTKLMKYLDGNSSKLKVGAGVELMMWHATSLGYTAIIDGSMVGLVYQDDIYEEIWPGDIKHGFIKRVREDGKIDLSLRPFGYNKVTDESQKILDYLEKHGGTMVFTDKSNPERISRTFRMSKKVFKKALGLLYKQKLVVLDKGSTRLASLEAPKKAKEAPEKNWEAPKKSVEAPKKAKEEIEKNWEAPKKTIEGPIELIDAPKKNERPIWPED
ncbi:MAG: S1-like domain-containing RNA-binding protein [Saprospiraceae bacterium]|nr:S1-like domain-containing RNA-binding protein [Saprospiraceae bacterium]